MLVSLKMLSVLGVSNQGAKPEDPKHTGCLGDLGCQSDFCYVNIISGFLFIPLLLTLISVTVCTLPLGQFSANTQNSQQLGLSKESKHTTVLDNQINGEGGKHCFYCSKALLFISIY